MLIDAALYRDGRRDPTATSFDQIHTGCGGGAYAWVGLYEPTAEEFDEIRRKFGLHELAVRDAMAPHHRPTLEAYGETHLFVVKTATYVDPEEVIRIGEVRIFFGPDFVVAVRYGEASPLSGARAWLEQRPDLLALGPGSAIYAIVDQIIEDYTPVLDGLEDDVTEVEEQVFSSSRERPTERIYKLKREVLDFHRGASPLRSPLQQLATGEVSHIPPQLAEYFVDLQGNLARTVELIESYRDLLTSVLEANLTQVNTQQNDDMRKISAWVALAAVPAAIGSIYGMNFRRLPLADHALGFAEVTLFMAAVCFLLWRQFRKSGWL